MRSKMEKNYGRYLNFLQSKGQILRWVYEPRGVEYWFPDIKRGTRSYKPDFVVTRPDETTYIVEVKGYMDAVSRTKLKRMAKYYPEVEIVVVGNREYRAISRWARIILGWE